MSINSCDLALTMGDPGGIGPEIIIKALPKLDNRVNPVVIGDHNTLSRVAESVGVNIKFEIMSDEQLKHTAQDKISLIDCANVSNYTPAKVTASNGSASLEYIHKAIELAKGDIVDAIVTAPIHKQAIKMAGSNHTGHTGILADRTDSDSVSMLLLEGPLRVAHVSTHVPLAEACELVTEERVFQTLQLTHGAINDLGFDAPRIAVAGLNPHASDGGLLGEQEQNAIEPAIESAQNEQINAIGPISPDTVFSRAAAGEFAAVVAMYHDQGHIPIKMLGFAGESVVSGVNVTIGLPIIRTSVDHGTAFDIVGEGQASEQSMLDAIETAVRLIDT